MFDRYTESARRAIYAARLAAEGAKRIEVEHLLAGIANVEPWFRESPLASPLPHTKPAAGSRARAAASTDMPLSSTAKRVLRFAAEEGIKPHGEINILHLALGILREGKSEAARRMREHGFTRGAILSRLPPARPAPQQPWILRNQHISLFLTGFAIWSCIVVFSAWRLSQVIAEERITRALHLNLSLAMPLGLAMASWCLATILSFVGYGVRSGPFTKLSRILVPTACLAVYLFHRFVLVPLV